MYIMEHARRHQVFNESYECLEMGGQDLTQLEKKMNVTNNMSKKSVMKSIKFYKHTNPK